MSGIPIKEQAIFDRTMRGPETRQVRISAININIVNEEVAVVYQLGNGDASQFEVNEQKSEIFTDRGNPEYFNALMQTFKFDMPALIVILQSKLDDSAALKG